jgi:S-adenosylmethionine synthetase
LSYAIGVVEPTSININTNNTSKLSISDSEISEKVSEIFDLRPYAIESRLKLRNPIYLETAAYGHMGRQPRKITKVFKSPYSGRVEKTVELFTWEKLDYLNEIKNIFKL